MPCSALIDPPRSTTRPSTRSSTASSSAGGPTTLTWMLPSPTWPNSKVRAPGYAASTRATTSSQNRAISAAGSVTSSLWTTPEWAPASEWASRHRHSPARSPRSVATPASITPFPAPTAEASASSGSDAPPTSTSR